MRELLLATRNLEKARELSDLLDRAGFRVTSLRDYPEAPHVVEDGTTFEENAVKKALAIARWSGRLTLADDSGLEVDALDGRPGVHSARYAGSNASDAENNQRLLKELSLAESRERSARYVCCLVLADASGVQEIICETCEGEIAETPQGSEGFGYDPLFYFLEFGTTFGNITLEEKQRVSHRGKALRKAVEVIQRFVSGEEQRTSPESA